MTKASNKTYISKRQIELYQRERSKQAADTEEAKQQLANISEEENLSAEEVDSDDLGEDITQPRE